jgi:phosphohistidine phosphatase
MALTLDLLRHGQALPAGADGDRHRVLSPAGVRGLESLVAHLAGGGWRPDRVFSSPYGRALHSAAIVAGAARPPVAVEILPDLEPERGPSDVLDALTRLGIRAGHVLMVGHQPLLGQLVGRLTGLEQGFSPGTLVRVHLPMAPGQGSGRITLALDPEGLAPRAG